MEIPTLETTRLLLTPPDPRFAADVYAYSSDPLFCRFIDASPAQNEVESRTFIERLVEDNRLGRRVYWLAVAKEDGRAIGSLGVNVTFAPRHRVADFGFGFSPAYWGRGLFQEAGRAVIAHAFGPLGYARLQAFVRAGNARSIRACEAMGFSVEAVLRSFYADAPARSDAVVLALVNEQGAGVAGKSKS